MSTNPTVGLSTYLGIALSILAGIGTVIAAVRANDTATITAGVTTIATAVTTLGGRQAQAVALAARAAPLVVAGLDGLEDVPGLSEGIRPAGPVEGSDG